MADNSRIWFFQATEFLEFEQVERISARLLNFLESWQAHGKPLQASFTMLHDRFLVVALDEASYQATGCSIDKLVNFIKELETELRVSLTDRTGIAYRDHNNLIQTMHMLTFRAAMESGEFNENTIVFNNLVETKGEIKDQWEVPVAKSWHKQWLPVA